MSGQWEYNRERALRRDNGKCQGCGLTDALVHVHHKTPRGEGGSDKLSNLTTLCPDCHAAEHHAEACNTCGAVCHDEDHNKQVFDEDGAVLVTLCDDCWGIIQEQSLEDGCSLCGSGINGRAKYAVADFDGTQHPLCKKCRKNMVFSKQWQGREYFDEHSLVDFQHWEADS